MLFYLCFRYKCVLFIFISALDLVILAHQVVVKATKKKFFLRNILLEKGTSALFL